MDSQFLMKNNEWLRRGRAGKATTTHVSKSLRERLILEAMKHAFVFCAEFFNRFVEDMDVDELLEQYLGHNARAKKMGLFQAGGIQEKEHLNFWCLSMVYQPSFYVESGVFTGSSLHAFLGSSSIQRAIAIDPDLSNLKVDRRELDYVHFVDDSDFSQVEIPASEPRAFAYFDDHVDSAARLLQAAEKGLRFVLFDDSTGFEGICQRAFPALPTVPMILNADIFQPGDEISWVPAGHAVSPARRLFRQFLPAATTSGGRVSLQVGQDIIGQCRKARARIKRCERIPNVGDFLPQSHPKATFDSSKFLIELN